MKKGRPRNIEIPIDEVRELTNQGWRLGRLSKKYGCSKQTILNRMNEAGIQSHPKHSSPGENNSAWKGGKYLDNDGYILIYSPNHPYATKQGRVREHRLVMEKSIGRYLLPSEVVHHIDGNKQNNSIENLKLYSDNAKHLADDLKGKIPNWTSEGKKKIKAGILKSVFVRKKHG